MSETCATCERLEEELRIATVKVFEAEQAVDSYELNPEFDPKDSKRHGELRLAVENAQKSESEVTRRQAEHRLACTTEEPNLELMHAVTEAAAVAVLVGDRKILLAFQSFYQGASEAADRATIQAEAAAIVAACEPYLKAHPDLKDAITRLRALITPTNPS